MSRQRGPIRTAHPLLREILEIVGESGLSDREMSDRLGLAHNSLSLWRRGVVLPSLWTLLTLCQGLDLELKIVRKDDV